jgi:hypothetical protein
MTALQAFQISSQYYDRVRESERQPAFVRLMASIEQCAIIGRFEYCFVELDLTPTDLDTLVERGFKLETISYVDEFNGRLLRIGWNLETLKWIKQ